jgi:putative spermidine/putrescine transport system ATP-binding protein
MRTAPIAQEREQARPAIGVSTPAVSLRAVRKTFGDVVALDGVDLDVRAGEFFTMLGASGSGKTTMLRVIAGFEQADSGTVMLHGVDVTRVPPYDRDVNTVFQDYALFPHMNVLQNVEYGLRVKHVPAAQRRRRANDALRMVGLPDYGRRKPDQLSGGQRQRVALARAIVNRPSVLLLDEPLGALDLKLRQSMQLELKRIQREAGITFIFVTHDQEEALTMSDRIAVFHLGRIEQVGSPVEIYENPANEYVADFIGVSNTIPFGPDRYAVRPERMRLLPADASVPDAAQVLQGTVGEVIYLGVLTRVQLTLDDARTVSVAMQNETSTSALRMPAPGERVRIAWWPAQSHRLDPDRRGRTDKE